MNRILNIVLTLLSIGILFTSCESEINNEEIPETYFGNKQILDFNGISYINIKTINAPDSNFEIMVHGFQMLSDNSRSSSFIKNSDNIFSNEIKCFYPLKADFFIVRMNKEDKMKKISTLFIAPGDTLNIVLDLTNEKDIKKNLRFEGKYADYNNYLNQKGIYFNNTDFNLPKALASNYSETYKEYRHLTDSLIEKEFSFFNNYIKENPLPQWETIYELNDLKYTNASSVLNGSIQRSMFQFKDEKRPDDWDSFMDTLNIYEPNAIYCPQYYMYIHDYKSFFLPPKNNRKISEDNMLNNLIKNDVVFADSLLKGSIRDVFLANRWYMLANHMNIKNNATQIKESINDSIIANYLNDFIINKFSLNNGDKAPYFYLKDTLGNSYTKKSFNGKLLYIFFWDSGCKPCLETLKNLNNFIDSVDNDNFIVMTINTDPTEETWKYILKRFNPKSINVRTKGNWREVLNEDYDIKSHPHFCLINKDGTVIENKCDRPNERFIKRLKTLLESEK